MDRSVPAGMPLEEVHLLLTYRCLYVCPHCFVHSGPDRPGAFTTQEVEGLVEQVAALGGVARIYFEGGEPALHFPTLLAGVRAVARLGMEPAMVTCGYFATNPVEGELWLRPLVEAGLRRLEVSIDELHGKGEAHNHARNLVTAARAVGLQVAVLSACRPGDATGVASGAVPILLRGRAAQECVEGLELRPWDAFDECSDEELESPRRVHIDAYGHVHVCQGLLAGNVWDSSLAQVVGGYDPRSHAVIGPLLEGGPAALFRSWLPGSTARYASACHACYDARRQLRLRLPRHLGPAQVYDEPPDPPPDSYD